MALDREGRVKLNSITTFQAIAEMYDQKGSQKDIAVLDFQKLSTLFPMMAYSVNSSNTL